MKIDNALALYIYDENNVAQEKIWTVTESSRDVWNEVDITFQKPMPTKVRMDLIALKLSLASLNCSKT